MEKYTEEEARKKACPMTRNNVDRPYYFCLGSVCMKWCWRYDIIKTDKMEFLGVPKTENVKTDKGYCNL